MLANPWVILGAVIAFGLAVAGAYFKGHANGVETTTATYELAIAKQQNDAAQLLAAETKRVADVEHNLAVLAAELEKVHADDAAKIADKDASIRRGLDELGRLRRLAAAQRRECGAGAGSADNGTGVVAGDPAGSAEILAGRIDDFTARAAAAADKLAAIVRECVPWAAAVAAGSP